MKNQDNNFKRALLKELTGFNYKEKEGNTVVADNDDEDDAFDFIPAPVQTAQATIPTMNEPEPEPEFSYNPTPRQQAEVLGTTTVSRGSIINGGIQTRENVVVDGVVNGDISSKGKVSVKGKVDGNISGFDVDICCDELVGDIVCESKIVIQATTRIKGNLYANRATVLGTVEGNIVAKDNIEIAQNAVIFGDIKANTVSVSEGAVIYGMVTIGKSKPDTSPF